MFYLILAILSSSLISIIMKLSKNHVYNKIMMFVTNYIVCTICSLFFIGNLDGIENNEYIFPIWFGVLTGFGYLGCFLLLELNIRKNGVVLSSTFSKLGLLVPIFIAIIFYHETPSILKIIGIILAIIAIIIMNIEIKKKDIDSNGFNIMYLLLILLLLFGGLTDASSTIFEHTSDFKLKGLFLSIIFSSALFISLIILVIQHRKISIKDILFGLGIGIPNYFSSFFLLNSLNSLDAVIVYPTYSVSTIVIITLVGVLFFKEKLKLNEIIGMVIIIGSIALLNI